MKIVTSKNGKKTVKISKNEWKNIGKKAGWIKISTLDDIYNKFQLPNKPVFVSLYEIERAYGGPEEGGWWYNVYNILSSKKFFDIEEAEQFAEQLRNEIKTKGLNSEDLSSSKGFDKYPDPSQGDPAYDHSDSDIPIGFSGDARNYRVIVEDVMGESETKEIPHYE